MPRTKGSSSACSPSVEAARLQLVEGLKDLKVTSYGVVTVVGARADRLVRATVKSFFGSRGVVADHVTGATGNERWKKLYALLNNAEIRNQVLDRSSAIASQPQRQVGALGTARGG